MGNCFQGGGATTGKFLPEKHWTFLMLPYWNWDIDFSTTCDIKIWKDLGHLWLGYIRKHKTAGTLATECSLTQFWTALKLLFLGRFTWFKKLGLLSQTLRFECNWSWKDLGRLTTLEFAPTLGLKSTIISRVANILIKLALILLVHVIEIHSYIL